MPGNSTSPDSRDSEYDARIAHQRLADILDNYLQRIEDGTPIDIDELVACHPGFSEPLREYLSGLNLLNAGLAELAPTGTPYESVPPHERGRLGDYELLREIGRGGMGVVYEAQQISLDRRVALKVLPFAAVLDRRQMIRFENESRAAAQLHHPHIVPVYGVGCDRGVHFYAMQFIEGGSIRELIDQMCDEQGSQEHANKRTGARKSPDGPGSSPEFLRIRLHGEQRGSCSSLSRIASRQRVYEVARLGIQAASALHAAHQCGVVHRDIKPSNLMLDSGGDLWITDFGLARCQTETRVTRSGDLIGTLHYMSPEQGRGDSAVADPRTDIYSLGVTLYEMLTLRRPFEGTTHGEVLKHIELGINKPIRHWNARVPHDFENVIAKAMATDPADRYQDAEELQQDLQRFVDGKATHAKPPSKAQLLSRWATRNRGVVATAVAALCVVCATLTVSTLWLANERAVLTEKHKQANHKLATTESTFEKFGLATAERLKQIPGSESTRQALLSELLEHYQTLLAESADAPSLREDRAITSTKIANVYRESGDLRSAVDAYRAAQADFGLLREGNPDRVASQLAKCLSSTSIVLMELGEIDQAAGDVHEAICLQERLVDARNNVEDRIALAASYVNLGSIESTRNTKAAIAFFEKAATLAEQSRAVAADDMLHNEALSSLASIYGQLSSQLQGTNRPDAITHAERAVHCTRSLVQSDAERCAQFRKMHATNCNNLATLYARQGQNAQAIDLFKEAALQLQSAGDRESLVVTLCNLAKTQHSVKSSLEAVAIYREAITVQSALLLDAPGNLNHVSRLGALQNNLAFTWHRMGKPENASVAYEAAIEYQHRAFKLAPTHMNMYRDSLSRTFFNASRTLLDSGRPFEAAELQQRRGELWPDDSEQLFSVATNMAVAIRHMPNDDPRRGDWRNAAARTLRKALAVDSNRVIDSGKAAKLARFVGDNSTLGISAETSGAQFQRSRHVVGVPHGRSATRNDSPIPSPFIDAERRHQP